MVNSEIQETINEVRERTARKLKVFQGMADKGLKVPPAQAVGICKELMDCLGHIEWLEDLRGLKSIETILSPKPFNPGDVYKRDSDGKIIGNAD